MRVAFEDLTVFERSRLAFVAVDGKVAGFVGILRHESPLEPRDKACSTPATQARLFDDLDDGIGIELTPGPFCLFVAAYGEVIIDLGTVDSVRRQ
ncbi:hypothetical protein HRbin30_03095 [bacterium HR30]|nr:hypothetical protein HRbin30_03095 [bacterium HR30]